MKPVLTNSAKPPSLKPIKAEYDSIDVTDPIQSGYDKLSNLQDNLIDAYKNIKLGKNKFKIDLSDVPVPSTDFRFNGEEIQESDDIQAYGYAGQGYGQERRNDPKEIGEQIYGYEKSGFGTLNQAAHEEESGAKKQYGYRSAKWRSVT